jgi:hypothetical protein
MAANRPKAVISHQMLVVMIIVFAFNAHSLVIAIGNFWPGSDLAHRSILHDVSILH